MKRTVKSQTLASWKIISTKNVPVNAKAKVRPSTVSVGLMAFFNA